jgi:hypothetical protein
MSGSASFHNARKFSNAFPALAVSPASAEPRNESSQTGQISIAGLFYTSDSQSGQYQHAGSTLGECGSLHAGWAIPNVTVAVCCTGCGGRRCA